MKTYVGTLATLILALLIGTASVFAQGTSDQPELLAEAVAADDTTSTETEATETEAEATEARSIGSMMESLFIDQPQLQFFRPYDQRGLNVFETPKADPTPFVGFQLRWGGAFAQQMQGLSHENTPHMVDDVVVNQLEDIGVGFNTAAANLYLDAQLFDGIRVHLATYLSSKHHPEAWVKGGYLQVDRLPFGVQVIDDIMQYTTIRAGHFQINYGDAQFRRSDNAQAVFNPFVENLILDAFTTEIGGEVAVQYEGFLAVAGVTGGEIQGRVVRPDDRAPSFYGKLGVDRMVNDDLRVRLTGSAYTTKRSIANSLFWGDRAGSRYNFVVTPAGGAPDFSGRTNPVLNHDLTAFMINPFVQFRGFELFGVYEQARGRNAGEYAADADARTWDQWAIEAVYRFLPREQMFVGLRYNEANGQLVGSRADVSIDRVQAGFGWFITPNVLTKVEYVSQRFHDFPAADVRSGARFNGFMVEGVVAF